MTSDDYTDDGYTEDWDEFTFGPTCDKHDYRCWSCGKPKADPASVFGGVVTFTIGLLLFAVVITPLLWLVRVAWGWAL